MGKSKVSELEKKKDRVENELNKANERLDTLKQSIAKKENELKQIEAEIVSALLTENNLSFSELTALLSEKESGGEASVYRE
ncbi:type III secretion system protein PrgM [Enterococcus faecalis]|uniref:type III secretion system protein PrgM n=1 Tax=Enterococcus faecalis TaxID=1351 RepID=UPI00177D06AA|nr:type III secretion system protein PrgM [Enterococcus faecalis]EGO6085478.1 type III secretion system protein PrgM [Enterococcus faecalis]MBD9846597.1 type III secretion system protein PrgM [Enterococcus faecalis]MBD9974386.1 type III secretion system protein PrgM [Enterococcus faecalis]MCU9780937.1 type III secretion system protein PrgM [Enterococcus faecalis]HAP4836254.1 type III secretion system protein PrgM [Enterococcus faecalis]